MTCKDCNKRTPECHIDCPDYAEQQKKFEKIREARRQEQAREFMNVKRSIKKADNIIAIKKRRAGYN